MDEEFVPCISRHGQLHITEAAIEQLAAGPQRQLTMQFTGLDSGEMRQHTGFDTPHLWRTGKLDQQ